MNTKIKHQLEIDFGETLIVDGPRIGVAVSGGSDSVALLYLVCAWAKNNNKTVVAVTVDHNLRKEVKSEIKFISRICSDLSISHDVLSWKNWGGNGNLQAKARQARYKLINEWANKNNKKGLILTFNEYNKLIWEVISQAYTTGETPSSVGGIWSNWWTDCIPIKDPITTGRRKGTASLYAVTP